MPRAATGKAIGKVTELIRQYLDLRTNIATTVGRPEPPTGEIAKPRLNLFLFEAHFDPSLKNLPIDNGQIPPLWMVLKYLITAFDEDGESDTANAHEHLGEGLRGLQELSHLSTSDITLPASLGIEPALEDNPEILKITFDEAPSDLLARLMQGADEKYRFSMAFQVRPVMIVPEERPDYSLLVGVDYSDDPPETIGGEGIRVPVLPSMGPKLHVVDPPVVEPGDTLTLQGTDLHLADLSVHFGPAELDVTAQQTEWLRCRVDGAIAGGEVISAGSHSLSVVQQLPGGRSRRSNLLIASLKPTLGTTTFAMNPDPDVFGRIMLEGTLLGTESDDVIVALYREGEVAGIFDRVESTEAPPGAPPITPQTQRYVSIEDVPPGTYRVLLRVNGQQAMNSPTVEVSP